MPRASAQQIIILGQGVLLFLFLNLVGLGGYLLWEPATPFYMIGIGMVCVVVLLVCGLDEENPNIED